MIAEKRFIHGIYLEVTRGVGELIFVTVGSRNYPFDRLFQKLDELYERGILQEEMFAQIGVSTYRPRYYAYQSYISADEFDRRITEADIVISHGATGSVMKALNAGKKVVVVSRLEKYHEHINDHQIQTNEALSDNGYALMADPELENLGECIERIHKGTDGLRPWENQEPLAVVNLIDQFIQDNWYMP